MIKPRVPSANLASACCLFRPIPSLGAIFCPQDFIELPGAGHCPMDEAPQLTDPVVLDFVAKHYSKRG